MSMERLLNAYKLRASGLDGMGGQPRIGLIASVDPTNHAAKVRIQPEDVLTGWMPIAAVMATNGIGIVAPPTIGDQVLLIPQEGDAEHWIISHRLFSTVDMPPVSPITSKPIQSGEIGLFNANGAYVVLHADGMVYIRGDLHVNGEIFDRHGSLDRLRQHYDLHVHGGIQTGASNTLTTSAPDPE